MVNGMECKTVDRNVKVSVVMSIYDGERYLRPAIESMLNQTFADFEFIIINDGSSDGTEAILRSYRDRRIVTVSQQNTGLTHSLNRGLRMARGEFIARMDADDVSEPMRLESQVRYLESHDEVGLLGSSFHVISESGDEIHTIQLTTANDELQRELMRRNCFCHGAAMFRRGCIEAVGGYREEFPASQDYDLWLRIAEKYHVANIESPLYRWRINPKSVSVQRLSVQMEGMYLAQELARERRTTGKDRLEHLESSEVKRELASRFSAARHGKRRVLAQNRYCWAKNLFEWGDYESSKRLAMDSLALFPFRYQGWLLLYRCLTPRRRIRAAGTRPGENMVRSVGKVVRKRRIGFVTRSAVFGGAEKHLSDLLARMPRESVEPIVMCFDGNPYADMCRLSTHDHVDVVGGLVWRSSLHLRSFLLRMRLDTVVFVNSFRGMFPGSAYIVARLLGIPKVYAIEHSVADHGPSWIPKNGTVNRLRRVIGKRARIKMWARLTGRVCHRTICVSEAVRERLVSEWGYPARSTITIRNGVDLHRYSKIENGSSFALRRELGISEAEPIVLCVARLSEEKGVSVLIEALWSVEKGGLRFHSIIVGDGPLRTKLEKRAAELGLRSRITFMGHQEDVRPYYAAATICVLPSLSEGLPLVLLEAMASGVPCVVTQVGGIEEVVTHGVDGFIVPPRSPDAVSGAIRCLLENEPERARIAAKARMRVEGAFDIDITARKIQAVLFGHEE